MQNGPLQSPEAPLAQWAKAEEELLVAFSL